MPSIRRSIETNRKILILIAILMVVILAFLFKLYNEQKIENQALRLKILSMSVSKKTPKTWSELKTKLPPAIIKKRPTLPAKNIDEQPLAEQDIQMLAVTLEEKMGAVKEADLATLDKNIAIANEIISREPDSYAAYKAKLISLLTKEGKFNQEVEDSEIDSLLENMAQFNMGNDSLAIKEAVLFSDNSQNVDSINEELNTLNAKSAALTEELSNTDPNDFESVASLKLEINRYDELLAEASDKRDELVSGWESSTAPMINEDVVEIPFMRMLAKNDYESVVDNAQGLIEQFPDSPSGYFYLVKALELQGQKDEAFQVLQNTKLSDTEKQNLIKRLETSNKEEPKNYWMNLSF